MRDFESITSGEARSVRYVLCDIDDTITTDGKLTARAYSALWDLHEAGIRVIPVTGRPAGWCDLIVRQWPVYAVIGENGAFVYYLKEGHKRVFLHPSVATGDVQGRLEQVKQACLKGVPGCRVSGDQFARIYDVAIDFNEEPPYLGLAAAEQIRDICVKMGAQAKISSIHVNTWYGDYDKVSMAKLFLQETGETDPRESVLFFGDSPNDEPMFGYFPMSCAVANIAPFLEKLSHKPTFLAGQQSGAGFAQCVKTLLARR
ncbi:HAD-IIB family hydrolase [Ruthenibacterium sp. CLA-JM-H11]|uniref:HAD-IIB family hydrolase n=1 Tax=Ruthenibacterium intestinale TaxID=3133163 RepID=A0ABV1GGB7_9FIRM